MAGQAYVLVFDGGSRGNPGPAYGSYRLCAPGERPGPVRRLRFGRGTNNEAEYRALISGLADLLAQLRSEGIDPGSVHLEVRGDSQLVIRQLDGEWKTKEPRLRTLRDEARALLAQFAGMELRHQPRSKSVALLGH